MTGTQTGDDGLEGLGTPPEKRTSQVAGPRTPKADASVRDPHGATDPVTADEYVGRRRGLGGLLDSIAYGFQLAVLSIYGPADQSGSADPVERLKRKYGRSSRHP
jgi:hypothetical protein